MMASRMEFNEFSVAPWLWSPRCAANPQLAGAADACDPPPSTSVPAMVVAATSADALRRVFIPPPSPEMCAGRSSNVAQDSGADDSTKAAKSQEICRQWPAGVDQR